MPRPLVVGNGKLSINFDQRLALRELYYPHAGMLNHSEGERNLPGAWVEGRFSWLDEGAWSRHTGYRAGSPVTEVRATNRELGLEIGINDAVHCRLPIYLRRVRISDLSGRAREIRLFFTADLCLDETDVGDTALFDPSAGGILHYKRKRCFLISGVGPVGGIYQYATGHKRFGGVEGTWRDAEDGRLEGHPISQGAVDSTISLQVPLGPGATETAWYWIAVGRDFSEARSLGALVVQKGPEDLVEQTESYWRSWLAGGLARRRTRLAGGFSVDRGPDSWADLSRLPPELKDFYQRNLLLVMTQIDREGGILASNDRDIMETNRDHYCYVWPRDGALIAHGLDRAGYPEVTRRFFQFCGRTITPEGYYWPKYHADGSVGSSWHPWVPSPGDDPRLLPIQADETGLVIWALEDHYRLDQDLEFLDSLYEPLVVRAADFLAAYRDQHTGLPLSSYDLWEERRGVFTFTCAAVAAGLASASRLANLLGDKKRAALYGEAAAETTEASLKSLYHAGLGRFLRGLYPRPDGGYEEDSSVDSSLAGPFLVGLLPPDDPRVVSTMTSIRENLWVRTTVGGLARYQGDYYFRRSEDLDTVPGNPWIITTLWLAQWYARSARSREELNSAIDLVRWAADRAMPGGVLPEQLHPYSGGPLSVAPLTWSHGTAVNAILDVADRMRQLGGPPGPA